MIFEILSQFSEPGYYETDDFGIRIENVIQVIEAPNSSNYFGGYGACKFNDVTMVPIQKKMISIDLLTDAEVNNLIQRFDPFLMTSVLLIGCFRFCQFLLWFRSSG